MKGRSGIPQGLKKLITNHWRLRNIKEILNKWVFFMMFYYYCAVELYKYLANT